MADIKTDHATCVQSLIDQVGVDITVSTSRPLVIGPYTTDAFVCPHGTAYWIEPTGEQIAAWARDGVE